MVQDPNETPKSPRRRTLLEYVTGAVLVGGVGAAAWPFVSSMGPNKTSKPPFLIDFTSLKEGESKRVRWYSEALVVRYRTAHQIAHSRLTDPASLRDSLARNALLAPTALASDENRCFGPDSRYILMSTTCTRLDCIVTSEQVLLPDGNNVGHYICPCCSARYDAAGRLLTGPAPMNLPIPFYVFETQTRVLLHRPDQTPLLS